MIKKNVFLAVLLIALLQSVLFAQAQQVNHVVEPGDTLFGISLYYGVSVDAIANCNDIINPALVQIDIELRIPNENWPCATGQGDAPAASATQPQSGPWPQQSNDSWTQNNSWTADSSSSDASGPWTPVPGAAVATAEPVVSDESADDASAEDADESDADADSADGTDGIPSEAPTPTLAPGEEAPETEDADDEAEEDEVTIDEPEIITTTGVVSGTQVVTVVVIVTATPLPGETVTESETVTETATLTDTVTLTDTADADDEDAETVDVDEAEADDEVAEDTTDEEESAPEPTDLPPTAEPTPWPTHTPWPTRTPVPPPVRLLHVVESGDSLSYLSLIYDVPISCILDANDIVNINAITIGDELIIFPQCDGTQPIETWNPPPPPTAWPTSEWVEPTAQPTAYPTPVPTKTSTPLPEPSPVGATPTLRPTEPASDEEADASDPDVETIVITVTATSEASAVVTETVDADSGEAEATALPTIIPSEDAEAESEEAASDDEMAEEEDDDDDAETSESVVAPPAAAPAGSGSGNYGLGGLTSSFDNVEMMQESGMTWVKSEYEWTVGSTAESLKARIDRVHTEDMKILLSITAEKPSVTLDTDAFTDFLGEVAALSPDAIEVWQGQNTDLAWAPGQINAATYVNAVLKPAHEKIKAADSDVAVISGALLPTNLFRGRCNTAGCDDVPYLTQMFAVDAGKYMDCIGVHFLEGTLSPWERTGDTRDDHYTRYYPATVEAYRDASNNSVPLCITAMGYLADDGLATSIGDASPYAWAQDISVTNQADWLGQAVSLTLMDPRVEMMIIDNVDSRGWNISTGNITDDLGGGYAIVRADGTCIACENIKTAMASQ